MLKHCLAFIVCMMTFTSALNAISDMDSFIRDRCGSACNGESDDCTQCYNTALDLYDQEDPVSPEANFDILNKHGKLEIVF